MKLLIYDDEMGCHNCKLSSYDYADGGCPKDKNGDFDKNFYKSSIGSTMCKYKVALTQKEIEERIISRAQT